MKKKLLFEFSNYFFFYGKFFLIIKALFKKKNLKKSYQNLEKIILKQKYILNKNSIKIDLNSNNKYKIKKFYLNIFKKKYYFFSNEWNDKNQYSDIELYFYKIRFNWLFFDNNHISIKQKIDLINSFILHYNYIEIDSYSVGERVSNWIMFLQTNKKNLSLHNKNLFEQSIKKQIILLINNLEFHKEKTNNHLFSNTKAIFLYSIYFESYEFLTLCRELFNFLNQHIFYKSGVLNEGSSHYNLLISKHIIEILYFNKLRKNNILSKKNLNFFKKILSNIYIFCLTREIVNFGDSTPDLPIKYLRSLPYISKKIFGINYPVLFKKSEFNCDNYINIFNLKNIKVPYIKNKNFYFYDKISGYLFIAFHKIKFYSQLVNSNVIKTRSHQHTEIGNFIIYYNDELIFNNLGRKNYNSDSLKAIGSASQNSYEINHLEPLLCHKLNSIPSIMHEDYFQDSPTYTIKKNDKEIIISSKFMGYKRFLFQSVVNRKFIISKNQIDIFDNISSKNLVSFNSYFHTNLKIKLKNKLINFKKENKDICNFKIEDKNINLIINKNIAHNQYSIPSFANTIKVSKKLKLNDNIKYSIIF